MWSQEFKTETKRQSIARLHQRGFYRLHAFPNHHPMGVQCRVGPLTTCLEGASISDESVTLQKLFSLHGSSLLMGRPRQLMHVEVSYLTLTVVMT